MTLEEMEYIVNTTLIHLGVELKDCSKEELITINKLFIDKCNNTLKALETNVCKECASRYYCKAQTEKTIGYSSFSIPIIHNDVNRDDCNHNDCYYYKDYNIYACENCMSKNK